MLKRYKFTYSNGITKKYHFFSHEGAAEFAFNEGDHLIEWEKDKEEDTNTSVEEYNDIHDLLEKSFEVIQGLIDEIYEDAYMVIQDKKLYDKYIEWEETKAAERKKDRDKLISCLTPYERELLGVEDE